MHLHGLTSLPSVEEGMARDAPGETGHRGVWEPPEPQGLPDNKTNTATMAGDTQQLHAPGLVQSALHKSINLILEQPFEVVLITRPFSSSLSFRKVR